MKEDKYTLSSVEHALMLLDILSHHKSMTLSELCKKSGYDKASSFRMLWTLEKNGYVEKSEDAQYSLGLKFIKYGSLAASRLDIVAAAQPHMQRLCMESRHSVHLGCLSRDRVVTVHIEDTMFDIQVTGRVGMSAPAYSTAMGRVLLAGLPENMLSYMLEHYSYKHYSANSISSDNELLRLLEKTRTDGFATDIDDRYMGFGGVAVPIYRYDGSTCAALSIITISKDLQANVESYAAMLKEVAEKISHSLGM